ncbi:MAG TPA: hypothetical protein VHV82_17260 [Sporichthyaceae bacterium]|nr:hypothetical protein [Sporichthyaceae bacterium]
MPSSTRSSDVTTAAQPDGRWKLPSSPGIGGSVISGPARLVDQLVNQVPRVLTSVIHRLTGRDSTPAPRATAPDPRKSAPPRGATTPVPPKPQPVREAAAPVRPVAAPAPKKATPATETAPPAARKAQPTRETASPRAPKAAAQPSAPKAALPAPAARKKQAPAARRAPARKGLPVKDYESLSAADAITAIRALSEVDEVAAIAKHEQDNKARVTVINAAEQRARGLSAPGAD